MKKALSILIAVTVLFLVSAPALILAQNITPPTGCTISRSIVISGTACPTNSTFDNNGMCCVLNTIYNITDYVFIFLVVISALFIILGAAFIVTAQGNPENVEKGRKYILYAAIGLIVAFLAKAVPSIVKLVSGV